MSKLDQLKALGDAKRVSRTKGSPELEAAFKVLLPKPLPVVRPSGLRIKSKPKSIEPSGDGIALTSMAHPPGLIDEIAGAIRSGKLSLKSGPGCPVCKARRQARAAAQKKWRQAKAAKGEME